MILKNVLDNSSLGKYRKTERILKSMGFDSSVYHHKDSDDIKRAAFEAKRTADTMLRNGRPHECLKNPEYVKNRLLETALSHLGEYKDERDRAEPLNENATYYRNVKRFNNNISGYRCTYLGESREAILSWIKFSADERVMKVMEVLRYGSDEDFGHLYADLADGRSLTSAIKFDAKHITESSDDALEVMAQYCDTRWEGAWTWNTPSPKKFKDIIKENAEMRKERIDEMRVKFDQFAVDLFEGEIEQSQVIIKSREIIEDINNMISRLGKISAESITTLKDQVRTEYGEDMASSLEQVSNENISHAVDALSTLKAAIGERITEMESRMGHDPLHSQLDNIDDHYAAPEDEAGDMGAMGDEDMGDPEDDTEDTGEMPDDDEMPPLDDDEININDLGDDEAAPTERKKR